MSVKWIPTNPCSLQGLPLPSVTPLGSHSVYWCECRASVPEFLVMGASLGPEGWQLSPALGLIRRGAAEAAIRGGMKEGGWDRGHCPSDTN